MGMGGLSKWVALKLLGWFFWDKARIRLFRSRASEIDLINFLIWPLRSIPALYQCGSGSQYMLFAYIINDV
jgi:hypothetical protein